jgi:hypothetical protein
MPDGGAPRSTTRRASAGFFPVPGSLRVVGEWKRSSKCASSECVEVRRIEGGFVQVRSAVTLRPVLISAAEWDAFLAGAKAGEFDELD